MATRIALEQELQSTPGRAFALLRDKGFTERRLALEPALEAELIDHAGDEEQVRFRIVGELPAHWMPAGVDATPRLLREESWQRDGAGYAGTLTMSVHGLPITCTGAQALQAWQSITVVSLVADVEVNLPFVGQTVERMIRDRVGPAIAAEFELLAAELATG